MLAMLATEIRLERHSVRVVIDTGVVLSEPGHTDDEGVRKGGDVQGNSLFVPRYADRREVVVRYWASGGLVTVGHYHDSWGGFQFVGRQDILGKFSSNAIALTTSVYQTSSCRKVLTVPHAHIDVMQACVLRVQFFLQSR